MKLKVAALVGPTAVGKTEASLAIAERLGAEIVSVDSMQIYRGMDIGTAKADAEQRARVPHHLLDLKDPSDEVTVAEFQELARAAIDDVSDRGRLPLLVGGSGLYLRAVVDDLRMPPSSSDVRRDLETEIEEAGSDALYARLREADPEAAARIEPGNARRIVRALEVIEITGRPFSENSSWDEYKSIYDLALAGLRRERSELYTRIAERVDRMFEVGLVDEVRRLAPRLGPTARQALGYRQLTERPDATETEDRDAIVRATKRFARRQDVWFRSDPRIRWFDASSEGLVDDLEAYFRSSLALP